MWFLFACTFDFINFSIMIIVYNCTSEQDFISSAPTHVVFVFLIQSLIGLIQVEYQSKSLSPFDTRPLSMWTSFGAICIYSLGLATKMEPKTRSASYSKVLAMPFSSLEFFLQPPWHRLYSHAL